MKKLPVVRPIGYLTILTSGIFISLILATAAPAAPQGRPRIGMAGEWKYQILPDLKGQPGNSWMTTKLPGEFQFKDNENVLWLERDVVIPKTFKDRVTLNIGQLFFGAVVYVNGQPAGEIPAWGGFLDITPLVKPGETNSMRISLSRLAKGCAQVDAVTRAIIEKMDKCQGPKLGLLYYYDRVGINSTPELFSIENRPRDVFIEDVWYRTFTRGMLRLEPQVTFHVERPLENLTAKVMVYEEKSDAVVLQETFPIRRLTSDDPVQYFPMLAKTLRFWNVRDPYLYRGQVLLFDAKGAEIDRSDPVPFGMREFWVQGRDFIINGAKVRMLLGGLYSQFKTYAEAYAAGITLMPGRQWIGEHMLSNQEDFLTNGDRLGMATTACGIVTRDIDMSNSEIQRDYRTWAIKHMRRLRNHPSLLLWTMDYNIGLTATSFYPTELGKSRYTFWGNTGVSIGSLVLNELDPTRASYVHGGIIAPGVPSGNIYLNHIPYQESEEWPSEWARNGDRPFIPIEFMGSVLEQDFQKGMRSYVTEYAARLLGEQAYREEPDEYRAYAAYEVSRYTSEWEYFPSRYNPLAADILCSGYLRTSRAWRYWGLSIRPWIFNVDIGGGLRPRAEGARRAWKAFLESIKPMIVWIGGPADAWPAKDHQFYAGETVEKTVLGLHDLPGRDDWQVAWEAKMSGGARIAGDAFTVAAGPFGRVKEPFRFTVPSVEKPTLAKLTMTVTDQTTKKEVGKDQFSFTIWPKEPPRDMAKPLAQVAVIDPEGETTAWLNRLGVATETFSPGKQILILGRRALKHLKSIPFTAQDIAAGLRVVIMEQHCRDLGKIGLRQEDQCPRQAFIRQANHPLVNGLDNEALRDWRGEATLIGSGPEGDRLPPNTRTGHWGNRGNVASVIVETPQYGPFFPILDCEFDLNYTPLMTWRHGAGEILFCQLDLTGRVSSDPAATTMAKNMIRYLTTPLATRQDKRALSDDQAVLDRVKALGFAVSEGKPEPDKHVLLISGQPTPKQMAAARDFARSGGTVVVLKATEDFLGGVFAVKPIRITRAAREVETHELLTGVGPQLVHWREPLDFLALEAKQPNFKTLLGGLVGLCPEGTGRYVFLQADPSAVDDLQASLALDPQKADAKAAAIKKEWREKDRLRSRWHLLRLQSRILANLGLMSSDALAGRLFEVKSSAAPCVPVNEWVYLGPFVPVDDPNADPLLQDLSPYRNSRDIQKKFTNKKGERVEWCFPTDSQNGLGLGGFMDISRYCGARLMHTVFAVTQVWSSQKRTATIQFGADWWAIIYVNGQEIFRTISDAKRQISTFGDGFGRIAKCPLKKGWNDICVQVAAGANSHNFYFKISNPGDLAVAQRTIAPSELPRTEKAVELLPESVDKGYSFYAGEEADVDDPYTYIRW